MGNYDVRYSLFEKRELENTHDLGKYSIIDHGDHGFILNIGGQRTVTFQFQLEKAKGALYSNIGAASMREYYENQEASQEIHTHLFAYIGNNKIDLSQDLYPSEIRIKNTHVTGGMGEDSELDFTVEIVYTRNKDSDEWKQELLFCVALHGEERYTFQYATRMYDSIDGEKKICL